MIVMKKYIRIGIVIAAVVMSMMMLCSCKALDEAKHNHGIYLDEKKESLEFRGIRYTEITPDLSTYDGTVSFETEDGIELDFLQSGWGGAYITEADVPVLLRESYGDMIETIGGDEENPMIIGIYRYENGKSIDHYYCREDKVEEVRAALKHPQIDAYYLDTSGWDYETDRYVTGRELMDPQVKEVIDWTVGKAYDAKTDYMDYDELVESEDLSEEFFTLTSCDRELLFTDNTEIQIVRTTGKHRKYFIAVSYADDYYWNYNDEGAFETGIWHQVDEKDAEVLEELFNRYSVHADQFYFGEYDEDSFYEEEAVPEMEGSEF